MLRSWDVFETRYKDRNTQMPIAKQFLDKASGLSEPIGDEIFLQGNEYPQNNNQQLILPIDIFWQENDRVDPPQPQVGEIIELNEEEDFPSEDIIQRPPEIDET